MSQVDRIIDVLGGPTKGTRKLSKITDMPVGLTTVQSWKRRKGGIPPLWRYIMRTHADTLGLNDPAILAYLQPYDGI